MDESLFIVPVRAVSMVSPRDYRMSSLKGYVVNFVAGAPIRVPPHVYLEAIAIGARPVPVEETQDEPCAPVEETQDEPYDAAQRREEVDKAVTTVLLRNDVADFKADSSPKVNSVIIELPLDFTPRPSAAEVLDSYWRLQSNIDLAED